MLEILGPTTAHSLPTWIRQCGVNGSNVGVMVPVSNATGTLIGHGLGESSGQGSVWDRVGAQSVLRSGLQLWPGGGLALVGHGFFSACWGRQGRKGEEETGTLSSGLCCYSHISQSQPLLMQGTSLSAFLLESEPWSWNSLHYPRIHCLTKTVALSLLLE